MAHRASAGTRSSGRKNFARLIFSGGNPRISVALQIPRKPIVALSFACERRDRRATRAQINAADSVAWTFGNVSRWNSDERTAQDTLSGLNTL